MRVCRAFLLSSMLFVGGAAHAQLFNVAGTLEGGYGNYDTPAANLSEWRGAGAAVLTIDNPGFNLQANFGNSFLRSNGQTADLWRYDGDVYWRDWAGAIGLAGGGASVSSGIGATTTSGFTSNGFNLIHYGVFGEFYMLRDVTLRFRSGRIDGDESGYYASPGLVWYPLASIAVSITGDYLKLDKPAPTVEDLSIGAEYMPVRDIPVSLSLGYTYAHLSNLGGHQDILSVGLKWYFGGEGRSGSLADRERNGPNNWAGPPPTLVGVAF